MPLFETKKSKLWDGDDKYSKGLGTPIYTPKNIKPHIASLFDVKKYTELVNKIKDSNVSDEEKRFLIFAASRHIVFRYSLIADYYAHSDSEMQRLMEESALVILDIEDAIMHGFVEMSGRMEELIEDAKQAR